MTEDDIEAGDVPVSEPDETSDPVNAATFADGSRNTHVKYDSTVRYSANGKPIPKGLTPWLKGQSGNPGGRPRGFVGPAKAYSIVSQLTLAEVERLAKGKFPVAWERGRQSIYVQKAREMLEAHKRATPQEINGRLEGPIVQRIDLNLENGPLALLAALAPPAAAMAQRLNGDPVIDTPAVPALEAPQEGTPEPVVSEAKTS